MSATVAEKNTPLTPVSSATSHNETRADIACLICRSRKVRCDKTLPECRNCIRLGVPCPRYSRDHEFISRKELQKSAEDIFKAAGVEKRRVGSCEECRSSKHRCTKTRPSCRRCILRNLPCVYPSRSDRDQAPSTPSGSKQLQPSEHSPYTNDSQTSPTYPPQHYPQYQQSLPHPYKPHQPPAAQRFPQHHRTTSRPENYPTNHYPSSTPYPNHNPSHTHHQSPVHQSAPQFTSFPSQHHAQQQQQQQPRDQPPNPPNRQLNTYAQSNGHAAQPLIPRTVPGPPPALGTDFERLYSDTLPNDAALQRRLLEVYFERSAPLCVMSFIHKPSFMQSFDRASVAQDYGEPLLYTMCALGARHLFFDYVASNQGASPTVDSKRVPGEAWAERARQEVLREIHAPTIHHIMTMVLLCDYGLREDRNAMVFVLIAFLYRMIRLLSLDDHRKLENPTNPAEFLQRECEIRLVWACYYVDVLVGTGVEKNLCWRDDVPNIPLPCPEPNFLSQTPSAMYFVENIERAGLAETIPQLDLEALSILVVRLRSKVMRLIRKPQSNKHIWENESDFIEIINRLDIIYQHLPEKYHLSDLNMYVLKDKGILGGVFVLHLLIHAVVFDLTRTSLAGFNFPLSADFKHAPDDFRTQCQDRCRFHADQVSQLIRKAMGHGRSAFDDVFCADAAMESAKIQIVYAATVNRVPQIVSATRSNLCTNIEFLKSLNRSTETKNQVIRALLPICTLFGFRDIAEKYHEPSDDQGDTAAEVTGSADMHHLSRLAAFRRGRSELQQGAHSTSSPRTASSGGGSHASPLIQAGGKVPPRSATSNEQDGAPTTPTQRHPLQLMPSAGVMVQNGAILQPSIDDYIKTADEMSNLLTWNMPDLPPWMSYGDVMLPG